MTGTSKGVLSIVAGLLFLGVTAGCQHEHRYHGRHYGQHHRVAAYHHTRHHVKRSHREYRRGCDYSRKHYGHYKRGHDRGYSSYKCR